MRLILAVLPAAVAIAAAQTTVFNFEDDTAGRPPAGFTSYATGGGPPGTWVVEEMSGAPEGRRVVEQTNADKTDSRFPVLIADKGEPGDLDVSVNGKALSGEVDQAIGLVFRFRDPKSYYVVRANALENNFRLYKMVNGRRVQFAGANVKVSSGEWHTIRVVAKGNHIVCYFDGKVLIDARDGTYSAGKVGFWTKADSVTAFDNLRISSL